MLLRVQYQNLTYDYVDTLALDQLLEAKNLRQFYRPSEARWVDVYRDPVRGIGGHYSGPDRRVKQQPRRPAHFDPPHRSVWTWILVCAAIMRLILGIAVK